MPQVNFSAVQTFPVHYSHGLGIVSVLISMFASYAAFSLADRMRSSDTAAQRRGWLLGGSCTLGVGIWSMHYLGMQSLQIPVQIDYYVPTVILSLLLAVAASAVVLTVVGAERLGWGDLMAGGMLMGSGVASMNYVGMAAMRSVAVPRYNPLLVIASSFVAVIASFAALWIGFAVRNRETHGESMRVAAAMVMGMGIAVTHYTTMRAITFVPGGDGFSTKWTIHVGVLGEATVAVATGFILLISLATAALEKQRFLSIHETLRRLEESQRQLLLTERKLRDANEQLSELSIRDGLTDLYNRRHFDSVLDTEWRRARRGSSPIALLMVDVDCFKLLNDTYGHQRGDECLKEIAKVIQAQPRRSHDVSARYGGEEFAVLLPEAELSGALKVAEGIRSAVRDLNLENAGSFAGKITVSIGVCCRTPMMAESFEFLVREADKALYRAKELGRDRVEVAGQVAVPV